LRVWFSRLNTRPARFPVNASPRRLLACTHDLGSVWFARPCLFWTCTLIHLAGFDRRTMSPNATARRFRRKVSCEMQVRLPAQTTRAKTRARGGIGGQMFGGVHLRTICYGLFARTSRIAKYAGLGSPFEKSKGDFPPMDSIHDPSSFSPQTERLLHAPDSRHTSSTIL
jgi:hypothetical protein